MKPLAAAILFTLTTTTAVSSSDVSADSAAEGLQNSSQLWLQYQQSQRQERLINQQILESQHRTNNLRSVDDPRWGAFKEELPQRNNSNQWHRDFNNGRLEWQKRQVDRDTSNDWDNW